MLQTARARRFQSFVFTSVAVIFLNALPTWAEDEVPVLALDAAGHTAAVNQVLFTPDGKELITVSDDKTIRLWDVATGEPLRVLRTPIASGTQGRLYCAALAPDGRTLAVGGSGFNDGAYDVTLISLADEHIIRLLEGHSDSIVDLEFSLDGGQLISASIDGTARIWDVATGVCTTVLEGHGQTVFAAAFSPDGARCLTAADDANAVVWSVAGGEQLAVLSGHTADLGCVDWSRDGTLIATGSNDAHIRLWTPEGELVRTIEGLADRYIEAVHFLPDGKQLLYAQGYGDGEIHAGMIDVATGAIGVQFDGHTNSIVDAQPSLDGLLVASTGGNEREVHIWRTTDGELVQTLVSEGQVPWGCAWRADGASIAWGNLNDADSLEAYSTLERSFQLSQLEFGDPVTEEHAGEWLRAVTAKGSTQLVSTGTTSIDVRQGDDTITTIQPESEYEQTHDRYRCFTLLPGHRAAVGSDWYLWIADTQTGAWLQPCSGQVGSIWAVSPSPDGRYLLSAADDSTLCIWDIQHSSENDLEPLLNLFFAGEEWIAWTPQGYYAASPGGERLMGWHVNHGRDQLASFLPASQFRKQFYRPDVIKLLLRTGSVERALEAAGTNETIATVAENLPPQVEIVSPEEAHIAAESAEITVRVRATPTGSNAITSLQILLDGRPLDGQAGVFQVESSSEAVSHSFHVPLVPGVEHTIQARADSDVSYGVSKSVAVIYQPATSEEHLPSLYVLAIGVADYDDASLKLDFADDDARRLAKTLQERSFPLFDKIETRLVVDKDATDKGILQGLVWLKTQMTQHDIGVLFYSGHGSKDETGNFYFLPSNVDTKHPLVLSAISDAQIKGILQGIPGRLMVLLDACHAGTLGGDSGPLTSGRRKHTTSLTDDLVRDLSNDDYGVVVMASSMGREFSLESPENQSGVFTLAICEGLEGLADRNQDTHVYFNELDNYVSDRVKDLTNGQQHPVTAKPATIRPFPLTQRKQ